MRDASARTSAGACRWLFALGERAQHSYRVEAEWRTQGKLRPSDVPVASALLIRFPPCLRSPAHIIRNTLAAAQSPNLHTFNAAIALAIARRHPRFTRPVSNDLTTTASHLIRHGPRIPGQGGNGSRISRRASLLATIADRKSTAWPHWPESGVVVSLTAVA